MNRTEILEKLDSVVKSMPGAFYVHNDGDLNLEWDGNKVISIKKWNYKNTFLFLPRDFSSQEWETIRAFAEKAEKLLKSSQKYTVQVIEGQEDGYLNIDTDNDTIFLNDTGEYASFKAKFTKDELEKLKSNKEVHIDWDGVIIEESEEF